MIVAPLFAATFYVILEATLVYVFGFPFPSLLELAHGIVFACIYTYPVGWLLGLPSYVAYERLGLDSLVSYLFGGLIGGFIFVVWFVAAFPKVPEIWLPMVVSASASCAVFWFVAVREVHATEPAA
jgi:hypothetical protein